MAGGGNDDIGQVMSGLGAGLGVVAGGLALALGTPWTDMGQALLFAGVLLWGGGLALAWVAALLARRVARRWRGRPRYGLWCLLLGAGAGLALVGGLWAAVRSLVRGSPAW